MAGYPLKDDELEDIRRRLADVLSCDDACLGTWTICAAS